MELAMENKPHDKMNSVEQNKFENVGDNLIKKMGSKIVALALSTVVACGVVGAVNVTGKSDEKDLSKQSVKALDVSKVEKISFEEADELMYNMTLDSNSELLLEKEKIIDEFKLNNVNPNLFQDEYSVNSTGYGSGAYYLSKLKTSGYENDYLAAQIVNNDTENLENYTIAQAYYNDGVWYTSLSSMLDTKTGGGDSSYYVEKYDLKLEDNVKVVDNFTTLMSIVKASKS